MAAPLRSCTPKALPTRAAASYLGVSAATLRKWRSMGPEDPGPHGPAFIKISRSLVLYEVDALDLWLDSYRGLL